MCSYRCGRSLNHSPNQILVRALITLIYSSFNDSVIRALIEARATACTVLVASLLPRLALILVNFGADCVLTQKYSNTRKPQKSQKYSS